MRSMKFLFLLLAALLVPAAIAADLAPSHPVAVTPQSVARGTFGSVLAGIYSPLELQNGVFVGNEICLACHSDHQGFRQTQHAFALIRPMKQWSMVPMKGVMADTDANGVDDFVQGLDFNQISSAYDVYKPNAPRLGVTAGGTYTIAIGALTMPVAFVRQLREKDGSWLQRFGVRLPAADMPNGTSAGVYMSGVAIVDGAYFDDGLSLFYDPATKLPRWSAPPTVAQITAAGSPFDSTCAGCHVTGIRGFQRTALGEMTIKTYVATLFASDDPSYLDYDGDGNADLMNIGCESCHGPGSAHVMGDRAKIVNPAKLTRTQADEICGRCHSRFKSLPNNTFSFPYRDDTMTEWRPGNGLPLSDFYVDKNSYWPDGVNGKSTHLQYNEFKVSAHATNPFHKVGCIDCHDAHRDTGNFPQIKRQFVQEGITIPTDYENNTICIGCHAKYGPFAGITKETVKDYDANLAKIAAVTSAHTHHPYAPERMMGLSRCTTCHMPIAGTTPGGSVYSTPRHAFTFMTPSNALKFQAKGGQPTACGVSCHNSLVNVFGMGIHLDTKWSDAYDKALATELAKYLGPEGIWWKTAE